MLKCHGYPFGTSHTIAAIQVEFVPLRFEIYRWLFNATGFVRINSDSFHFLMLHLALLLLNVSFLSAFGRTCQLFFISLSA